MAKSRVPDQPKRAPEPEAVSANANPNASYDGASRIYADKSGKPHATQGSEGGANFARVTEEARATVQAALDAEAAGGDASHGSPETPKEIQ
jgi:hypothetical protein